MVKHFTVRTAVVCGLALFCNTGVYSRDLPRNAGMAGQNAPGKPLPPGGTALLPPNALSAFTIKGQTIATMERVPVTGQPFKEALRLKTTSRPANTYSVQLATSPTQALKRGDTLLATFYVRTVKGQAETGEANTQFVLEKGSEPYTKAVTQDVSIPAQGWKRIDIPFKAVEDLAVGAASVSFRLGFDPQTIEIGGVSLTNFGPNVALNSLPRTRAGYAGQEPGAAWRKAADARIEKIRKADLRVRVIDKNGKPVSGATVSVRMTRHAFPFGSAVAANWLLQNNADAQKYQQTVTRLFNRVVMENDLKWWAWQDNPERAKQGVAWLNARNISVRGHNLVWPRWDNLPRNLRALENNKPALAKAVTDHITEEATAMRGQLVDWDVVNEPYTNHDLQDLLGKHVLVDYYKLAKAADPKPRLYLNDYPPLDGGDKNNPHLVSFENNIQYLLDNGAPLEGIGFQGHYGGNVTAPERVLSGLDRFSKFKLPILITEWDIDTTDEQLQADYTRDFLTATFSHPAVNGVLMWGFWEGAHWKPNCALFRKDWSIKPNGQAWMDLVMKKWWTKVDGKTNTNGGFATRGFHGNYQITVTANGKTKTVPAKLDKTARH